MAKSIIENDVTLTKGTIDLIFKHCRSAMFSPNHDTFLFNLENIRYNLSELDSKKFAHDVKEDIKYLDQLSKQKVNYIELVF